MKNKRLKEQLEEANISYETENAFSEKIESYRRIWSVLGWTYSE